MIEDYSTQFCPVPLEQQPIYEYEQLKNSWLFCWATLEPMVYGKKLVMVWLAGWSIAAPIAAASFSLSRHPLLFSLSSSIGASFLVALVLVRLYLGWSYIKDRLSQETIFYEESGWYDGQTWAKPLTMLKRDRLIVSYQVEPVLVRLQQTAWVFLTMVVTNIAMWRLLT